MVSSLAARGVLPVEEADQIPADSPGDYPLPRGGTRGNGGAEGPRSFDRGRHLPLCEAAFTTWRYSFQSGPRGDRGGPRPATPKSRESWAGRRALGRAVYSAEEAMGLENLLHPLVVAQTTITQERFASVCAAIQARVTEP